MEYNEEEKLLYDQIIAKGYEPADAKCAIRHLDYLDAELAVSYIESLIKSRELKANDELKKELEREEQMKKLHDKIKADRDMKIQDDLYKEELIRTAQENIRQGLDRPDALPNIDNTSSTSDISGDFLVKVRFENGKYKIFSFTKEDSVSRLHEMIRSEYPEYRYICHGNHALICEDKDKYFRDLGYGEKFTVFARKNRY